MTVNRKQKQMPSLLLAVACFLAFSSAAQAQTATRSLQDTYTPAQAVSVSIQVNPAAVTQAWAVEETPPNSWTVSDITEDGVWDSVNKKVKWGPYFTASGKTVTYKATPPTGETGTKAFSGVTSFDGTSVDISGDTSIERAGDPVSILTNTNSVSVPEGNTATFQVKLSAQPSSNVPVSVSRVSGDSDISVQSGSSLTFTTSNWNTYQTVTLHAAEDSDTTNGTATIRCSASGLSNKDVIATESDNDPGGTWQSESVSWRVDYGNNWNRIGLVTKPGATQVRVHFSIIDVESGYDHLRTDTGNDWSGVYSNQTSYDKMGNATTLTLTSDESRKGYFIIDRVEWKGTAASPATKSGELFGPCAVPSAPNNVSASDGAYPDRVLVTWASVSGATSYLVYRNPSNNFTGAQLLNEVATTNFNDYAASAPTTNSSGGCGGGTTTTYHKYYYWVKAKNSCGTSGPGGPVQGWRGSAKAVTTFEKVLPSVVSADGFQVTSPDGPLAVRLTAASAIDPATVWGIVRGSQFETSDVAWIPIDSEVGNDGWVVFYPATPLTPSDLITMEVGGATVSEEAVEPVGYTFTVYDPSDLASFHEEKGLSYEAVWQPTETGESPVLLRSLDTVPGSQGTLPFPIGPAYVIGPDQVYEQPLEVWIPLPEGVSIDNVQLFYLKTSGDDAGWYEAENVIGWLGVNGYRAKEIKGVIYLGFTVQHGGVCQLGFAIPDASNEPSQAGFAGNALTLLLVCLTLFAAGCFRRIRNGGPRDARNAQRTAP